MSAQVGVDDASPALIEGEVSIVTNGMFDIGVRVGGAATAIQPHHPEK